MSEMEILAFIHSEEKGTWLLEGAKFPVCVARTLTVPQNQVVPIRVVNLDPLPVTLHKNTKVAEAELNEDEAVCVVNHEDLQSSSAPVTDILLQNPLPNDITNLQKEQFLSLIASYSDVIAQSSDDLGRTQVLQHHIDTKGAPLLDNRPDGSYFHAEKQFKRYCRTC